MRPFYTFSNQDLLTFTLRTYDEAIWGFRKMGPWRFALDLYKVSFIVELWFLRS